MGTLSFADLHEGQTFALGPHRVTRGALLAFAGEFDPQPFHTDEALAAASVLGGLSTSGWHTSSILMRMICDALLLKVDALGSTGIEEMKWLKPVHAGDVLTGELVLTGVRRSSKRADRGVITYTASVGNQAGQQKVFMRSMALVRVPA